MTTEAGAAEGADVAAREAALSSQDERDYEAEARKIGWKPADEFKDGERRPAKIKTAKEYIEDGESLSPFVKRLLEANDAKWAGKFEKLERVTQNTVAKMTKIHESEIAELKADRRAAAKAGDDEAVERISAAIEAKATEAPLTDSPKSQQDDAEALFAKENPWYGSNRKMTAFARGISQDLANKNPNLSFEDNIKQVLVAVREEFSEEFGQKKPAANGHAAVDGGGEGATPRSDPFAKLSEVERRQAEADMKKYPKIYPDKKSWMEVYSNR